MKQTTRIGAGLIAASSMLLGVNMPMAQESVEEFYRGRTIDMIIGYSPGGGYDLYARLVARFLGDYIPGNPEIVPRNMPGAASVLAANYIYNVAPQDGTVLGAVSQSVALSQVIDETFPDMDVRQFPHIGSPAVYNNVMITWETSEIQTFEDAVNMPSIMGATGGSTSSQYPLAMNAVLGTQFELITGYPGANELNFAMQSGEVDGRGSAYWAEIIPLGWMEDGLINVIVQIGFEREPELQDIPLLHELATDPEDQQLLRILSAPTALGRPITTTPNVPQERVDALREAFDRMVADPVFLEAAAEQGLGIRPTTGLELQSIVEEIVDSPPEITSRLAEFMTAQ